MRRVIDRGARPISMPDQQQKIFDLLSSGTAAEKIHALSFLAKCYVLLSGPQATKDMLANAKQFHNELKGMTEDASPAVRAWARYVNAVILPQDQMIIELQRMAADSYWPLRMIA